jgi:predicted DNA-binding transcriptional regulator YafY
MARPSAADRARRLLALLPLLRSGARIPLSEAARATGAHVDELASDLVTLSMCGTPPYTPDVLCAVFIEGGDVVSWADPPALDGPVRLSQAEAGALVAALEGAGLEPDDGLVARLLAAAGPTGDVRDSLQTRIVSRATNVLGTIARALDSGTTLGLRYLTGATGELSERTVHPWRLDARDGAWYLTAWCEKASDRRVFRVDRIAHAMPGASPIAREPSDDPASAAYSPDLFDTEELPNAVVEFGPDETLEERDWPGSTIERRDDGTTRVEIPVANPAWLARRVAAYLGTARLVEPAWMQEVVARTANTLRVAARSD